MHKVEKREVAYGIGGVKGHCGRLSDTDEAYCKHFIAHRDNRPDTLGMCKQVIGPINRTFVCNQWKPAIETPVNLPRRIRTKKEQVNAE